MSTLFDYEYVKHMATIGETLSSAGEINLEGVTFPASKLVSRIRRFAKMVAKLFGFLWRFMESLADFQAGHDERARRFPYSPPPLRGLW